MGQTYVSLPRVSLGFVRVFSGISAAIVATTLFAGGIAPAQAAESIPCTESDSGDVSVEALYDGYCIENDSSETLTLYEGEENRNGWGTKPPHIILPRQHVYFEVKYWWWWADNSKLIYKTTAGEQVVLSVDQAVIDRGGRGKISYWSIQTP